MPHLVFVRLNKILYRSGPVGALRGVRGSLLVLVALLASLASTNHAASAETVGASAPKPQSFDYVILALSWSPSFCASSVTRGASAQCQNPANRGFVVHGLWPQAADGARLRCPANKVEFSKALFERALDVFPDLKLAQSQWQRHGQCFGFTPDAYLELTGAARAKISIPDQFRAPNQTSSLPPDEIRTAFRKANPTLEADSISVSCRKATLVDVLICLRSDLSGFLSCPQVVKRSCAAATIQIPTLSLR